MVDADKAHPKGHFEYLSHQARIHKSKLEGHRSRGTSGGASQSRVPASDTMVHVPSSWHVADYAANGGHRQIGLSRDCTVYVSR